MGGKDKPIIIEIERFPVREEYKLKLRNEYEATLLEKEKESKVLRGEKEEVENYLQDERLKCESLSIKNKQVEEELEKWKALFAKLSANHEVEGKARVVETSQCELKFAKSQNLFLEKQNTKLQADHGSEKESLMQEFWRRMQNLEEENRSNEIKVEKLEKQIQTNNHDEKLKECTDENHSLKEKLADLQKHFNAVAYSNAMAMKRDAEKDREIFELQQRLRAMEGEEDNVPLIKIKNEDLV